MYMRKKIKSIAETNNIQIRVSGSNREIFRYYENLLMVESGTTNPLHIKNSDVIQRIATEAYQHRRKVKVVK
jgi:hypothetical protein